MKRIIFISGLVSANLMLFGALMKVLHLAGAGVLLTFSIFLFCFGFLPLALVSSYRNQERKMYKWLYVVTFLVFSIDLVGALFKIQHWPGAGIFMMVGVPLPFLLFLPVYLYQTYKNKEKSVLNNLGVMFGLTFLAVFSVLLTLNISASILNSFALNSFNHENSTKFNQTILVQYPSNEIVKQKADELSSFIDNLKWEILFASGNDKYTASKINEDYNPLNTINRSSSNLPIFTPGKVTQRSKVDMLKRMVNDYAETIIKSEKASNELKELAKSLFDISINKAEKDGESQMKNWKNHEFPTANLIIALDVLSRIQSNVRFVETEYLAAL